MSSDSPPYDDSSYPPPDDMDDFNLDAELEAQQRLAEFDDVEEDFLENLQPPGELEAAQKAEEIPKPRTPLKRINQEDEEQPNKELDDSSFKIAKRPRLLEFSEIPQAPTAPLPPPAAPARLFVYQRAPITGEFVTFSDLSGKRLFLTQQSEESLFSSVESRLKANSRVSRSSGGLLSIPIHQLIQRADEIETQKAIEDNLYRQRMEIRSANEEKQMKEKRLDSFTINHALETGKSSTGASSGSSSSSSALWVEKYRPRQFTELLSPEKINRDILTWIKEWDSIVFGRERTETEKIFHEKQLLKSTTMKKWGDSSNNNKEGGKGKFPGNSSTNPSNSGDNRPEHKILLLSGPPGLGKTSLAHILARLAGYNPIEINASEDRNEEVLIQKIRTAVEMKSGMFGGASARPNLVIIDEIDGVEGGEMDSGAINALIRIVSAVGNKKKGNPGENEEIPEAPGQDNESDEENNGNSNTTEKTEKSRPKAGNTGGVAGGKKKEEIPILRRPIICICNDPYVPALRPLRAVAKIFPFEKPRKQRLVERLKWICSKESEELSRQHALHQKNNSSSLSSYKETIDYSTLVDEKILHSLCDLVENDIRSALNTLQFCYLKGERLTREILYSLQIGQKDFQRNRFDILEKVWESQAKSMAKGGAGGGPGHASGFTSGSSNSLDSYRHSRFLSIYDSFSDSGEIHKLIDSLHWNYLNQSYHDPTLQKMISYSEWFSYIDQYSRVGQSDGEMPFLSYSPTIAVLLSLNPLKSMRIRLENPPSYQLKSLYDHHWNILHSFLSGENKIYSSGISMKIYLLDYHSSLMEILSPPLRAVNFALFTPLEKKEFHDLLDIMISLHLTYRQHFLGGGLNGNGPVMGFNGLPGANTNGTGNIGNIFSQQFQLEPPIHNLLQLDIETDNRKLYGMPMGNNKKFGAPNGNSGAFPYHSSISSSSSSSSSGHFHPLRSELPNPIKQMFIREIEFEILRRAEAKRQEQWRLEEKRQEILSPHRKNNTGQAATAAYEEREKRTEMERLERRKKDIEKSNEITIKKPQLNFLQSISNQLKANQLQKIRTASAIESNLHRRGGPAVVPAEAMEGIESSQQSREKSSNSTNTAAVQFKFHEGFTQAVRRTVSIAHFI